MCRDPKEFEKPDEFIPERWLRNEIREFSPFTSLPFGFGARSCVGRRVAETMVYMSIANVCLPRILYFICSWYLKNVEPIDFETIGIKYFYK